MLGQDQCKVTKGNGRRMRLSELLAHGRLADDRIKKSEKRIDKKRSRLEACSVAQDLLSASLLVLPAALRSVGGGPASSALARTFKALPC